MSQHKRVEELTSRFLDDVATEQELAELHQLIEQSSEAATIYRELLRQDAILRGEQVSASLVTKTVERVKASVADRVARGVMSQLKQPSAPVAWKWLFGRRFWGGAFGVAVAVLLAVGAHTYKSLSDLEPNPQEAYIFGDRLITPGTDAVYRVHVRDAKQRQPIANAAVKATLSNGQGATLWTADLRTNEAGMLTLAPAIKEQVQQGKYRLSVTATSSTGTTAVSKPIEIKRSYRVMLTTDKPIYQPGQTIHLRSLALGAVTVKPAGNQPVLFEIRDGKGNKVFKRTGKTSRFGIASADFKLASMVNLGSYTISARVGDTKSERTVEVKRYRLPKYRLTVNTEKSFYKPGDVLRGNLTAVYTFGEPVASASVEIKASSMVANLQVFATIRGKTDARGRMRFEVPLKDYFVGQPIRGGDASVLLAVKVRDRADHLVQKNVERIVSAKPIRVSLYPESGRLVANVDNIVYVLASYPDGKPAKVSGTVAGLRFSTSASGLGKFVYNPGLKNREIGGDVRDEKGVASSFLARVGYHRIGGRNHAGKNVSLLLRPEKAVYRVGQTMKLDILTSSMGQTRVFVDLVQDHQTRMTSALDVKQGRGSLSVDLPADLVGTVTAHAYWITRDGTLAGDTRVVQINRADELKVSAKVDKPSYRPGKRAELSVSVTDKQGKPVAAALGIAGVDEAVFALHEMRPGLQQQYFLLREAMLTPRVELHGHSHSPGPASTLLPAAEREQNETNALRRQLLLAAAVEQPLITATEAGSYRKQLREHSYARRRAGKRVWLALGLVLAAMALLLILAALIYGVARFFVRDPIDGLPETRILFRKQMRRLVLSWAGGVIVPVLTAMFVSIATRRDRIALMAAAIAICGCLVGMFRCWHLWRRNPLSHAKPLLRKLLLSIPGVYLISVAVVVLLGYCANYPRVIRESYVALIISGITLGTLLASFLLAAIAGGLVEKRSGKRTVLLALGWTAIPAGLTAALALFAVMGLRQSKLAAPLAGAVMEDGVALRANLAKSGPKPGVAPTGTRAAPVRVRRHFPETLLWRPQVITDETGTAKVVVPLADSITTWRMSVSAVSASGRLGATQTPLKVFQPFFVDVDVPVALTQDDRVDVPVAIYNYLEQPQTVEVTLKRAGWYRLQGPSKRKVTIGAKDVGRVYFTVQARDPGNFKLLVEARGSKLSDAVERNVRVLPDGEAITTTINETLKGDAKHKIQIPRDAIKGANELLFKVHPGSFSQVVEGLDNIFRMPSGCFEQTSSTTYPNVLVLDYMRRTGQINPKLEMKALGFISQGYQRLLSYEVDGGGFEWFGKSPAHLVLTAYGLMEFSDMAKVYDVDSAVISRTRDWLFSKQQDDGSWKPDSGGIREGAINQYVGQTLRTTAYVAWAVAEAGQAPADKRLGKALSYIAKHVGQEKDAYTVGLAANALVAAKHASASRVIAQLLELRKEKGQHVSWSSAGTGATFSRGNVLDIETTALAAYALVKAKQSPDLVNRALSWITSKKDKFGTFHSTQATVYALRALLAGGQGQQVKRPTTVVVSVNGNVVKRVKVSPENADVVQLIDLKQYLSRVGATIELKLDGDPVAYQLVATHYRPWSSAGGKKSPLRIDVSYDATRLKQRDKLSSTVTVSYSGEGAANMVVADLGIPPGFSVLADTFDALQQNGVIERYAIAGQQVIVYIRKIESGRPLSFSYKMVAKQPVKASAPSSRAYKYYEPEIEGKSKPVKLEVL